MSTSFDIMMENDNRLIIGIGPFDPGTDAEIEPDYSVQTVVDDDAGTQLAAFLALFDTGAQLSADGTTILPWPTPS